MQTLIQNVVKPWKVRIVVSAIDSKVVAAHALRSGAETDAIRFRRLLPPTISVHVLWDDEK